MRLDERVHLGLDIFCVLEEVLVIITILYFCV